MTVLQKFDTPLVVASMPLQNKKGCQNTLHIHNSTLHCDSYIFFVKKNFFKYSVFNCFMYYDNNCSKANTQDLAIQWFFWQNVITRENTFGTMKNVLFKKVLKKLKGHIPLLSCLLKSKTLILSPKQGVRYVERVSNPASQKPQCCKFYLFLYSCFKRLN